MQCSKCLSAQISELTFFGRGFCLKLELCGICWGNGETGEPTGARKARFNGYLTNQMSAGKFGCIGAAFNTAANRKLESETGQVHNHLTQE